MSEPLVSVAGERLHWTRRQRSGAGVSAYEAHTDHQAWRVVLVDGDWLLEINVLARSRLSPAPPPLPRRTIGRVVNLTEAFEMAEALAL